MFWRITKNIAWIQKLEALIGMDSRLRGNDGAGARMTGLGQV